MATTPLRPYWIHATVLVLCVGLSVQADNSCPPPSITDGVLFSPQRQSYNLSSNVSFACVNTSYILIGPEEITCLDDGTWDSLPPSCQVDCGPVTTPSGGGDTHYNCTTADCIIVFICPEGFQLDGPSVSQCLDTGVWDNLPTQCLAIMCDPPAAIEDGDFSASTAPTSMGQYEYNTTVQYRCLHSAVLVGQDKLLCSNLGNWSQSPPRCVNGTTDPPSNASTLPPGLVTPAMGNVTTVVTQNVTTTVVATTTPWCDPPESIPNGWYRVYGRHVIYKCETGFTLVGNYERRCQENLTWSGVVPECVLVTGTTKPPFPWKRVFTTNLKWEGVYSYESGVYHFQLDVLSVQMDEDGTVLALFKDNSAKFEVNGFLHPTGDIVFQIDSLQRPSARFPTDDWFVQGQLRQEGGVWVYRGHVESRFTGFDNLSMKPLHAKPPSPMLPQKADDKVNIVAVVLGVLVSLICIGLAIAISYFYAKRRTGFRSSGHRSLTSFENPVYDYANGLKAEP